MSRRGWMLVFLVYVTLDLSNPFVPGAFRFTPEECVDAIHRLSSPQPRTDASVPATRMPVVRAAPPAPSLGRLPGGGRHPVVDWLVDTREDGRALGDPPPSGDDH